MRRAPHCITGTHDRRVHQSRASSADVLLPMHRTASWTGFDLSKGGSGPPFGARDRATNRVRRPLVHWMQRLVALLRVLHDAADRGPVALSVSPSLADARLRAVPETPTHPSIERVREAAAQQGVTIEVTVFDESTHTAQEAAAALGAELGQIVKSLVFAVPGENGPEPLLCLVSGPNRVDIARLAEVTGVADIRRATAREARNMTGYSIGGIPPIGHPGPVRAIMDPDLRRYPVVWAAAGLPTAVFPLPPATLQVLANATIASIAEPPADGPESGAGPA